MNTQLLQHSRAQDYLEVKDFYEALFDSTQELRVVIGGNCFSQQTTNHEQPGDNILTIPELIDPADVVKSVERKYGSELRGNSLPEENITRRRDIEETVRLESRMISELFYSLDCCAKYLDPPKGIKLIFQRMKPYLDSVQWIDLIFQLQWTDMQWMDAVRERRELFYEGTDYGSSTCVLPKQYEKEPEFLIKLKRCTWLKIGFKAGFSDNIILIASKYKRFLLCQQPGADLTKFNENINKMKAFLELFFDKIINQKHQEGISLLTQYLNNELKELQQRDIDSPELYREDMVRKYLESGDEEDLHNDMLENHCQILCNLYKFKTVYDKQKPDTLKAVMTDFVMKIISAIEN